MIICKKCGKMNENDSIYCFYCGAICSGNEGTQQSSNGNYGSKIICPICHGRTEKGVVELKTRHTDCFTRLNYYPKGGENTQFMQQETELEDEGDGYYCPRCNVFIGVFYGISD